MDEIKELLTQTRNAQNANKLIKLVSQNGGPSIKVGCFCKQHNLNAVYDKAQEWINNQ
jgi:hypothetical protein